MNARDTTETLDHDKSARDPLTKREQKEAYENNKLFKRLARQIGQTIGDFNMIEHGDRVMVCLSGGKDSYAMLDILMSLRERAPIDFDIVAVNLDQKQLDFPEHVLPDYRSKLDIPYRESGYVQHRQAAGRKARRPACWARVCGAAFCIAW